jgi:hypothetical protein
VRHVISDGKFAMMFGTVNALIGILSICTIFASTFSHAQCSIDYVMVNGRVERPPLDGLVRVQLVYAKHSKQLRGESGEVKLEDGSFRIQIPFLTQSRAPVLGFGTFKCDRRPTTVVVTLVGDDREYDRVSLDLAKDFRVADPSLYALRTEVVLHGSP